MDYNGITTEDLSVATSAFYLEDEELVLEEGSEVYLRQCCPAEAFWDNATNEPSHQLFMLSSSDEGKLSGSRESKCTPERAYEERRGMDPNNPKTRGTWGLKVAEIESVGLRAVDDSYYVEAPPTGHTYIDMRALESVAFFEGLTKRQRKAYCKLLQIELVAFASARGRLYPNKNLFDELSALESQVA